MERKPIGDLVYLPTTGTVQPTDNPLEAIGKVVAVSDDGLTYHIEMYPEQPAWGLPGGSAPVPVWPYPGGGYEQDPLSSADLKELANKVFRDANKQAPVDATGPLEIVRVGIPANIKAYCVQVTAAELANTPDRRAFRKILGDQLQGVYQAALAEWEKAHPEAAE